MESNNVVLRVLNALAVVHTQGSDFHGQVYDRDDIGRNTEPFHIRPRPPSACRVSWISLDGESTIKGSSCGEWKVNGPAAQASLATGGRTAQQRGRRQPHIGHMVGREALCWHNGAEGSALIG